MVLPPTLYWSAQLAQLEPDALFAGVIDATTSVFYRWDDGDWTITDLPADTVRLVLMTTPEANHSNNATPES